MEIKFIQPSIELIRMIASDMREADAAEVWASHRHTPEEALMKGWEMSDFSTVVTIDGVPCAMLGLVIHDILSDSGIPWLLGTDEALKHKRQFIKLVPDVISEMLEICGRLFNYVHAENKVSIRWLKRIGFTIEDSKPYGLGGELFHRFHLEVNHV